MQVEIKLSVKLTIALQWNRRCLRLKVMRKCGNVRKVQMAKVKWGKKNCVCSNFNTYKSSWFRAFSVFTNCTLNRAHCSESSIELCLLPVNEQICAIIYPFLALFTQEIKIVSLRFLFDGWILTLLYELLRVSQYYYSQSYRIWPITYTNPHLSNITVIKCAVWNSRVSKFVQFKSKKCKQAAQTRKKVAVHMKVSNWWSISCCNWKFNTKT